MHSEETATSAGSTDTLRKNARVRAMEVQRSLNVHNVEKTSWTVIDTDLHIIPKIHRKEDG